MCAGYVRLSMALNMPQELGIQLLNWQLWVLVFKIPKLTHIFLSIVRTLSYAILLVYVDDLVITGNNLCFVSEIVAQLGNWFSLKDMGQLNFFLGKEAISTKSGLFFSQHKYSRDLLSKTNMIGAKDVLTPLSTTTSLKLVDGTSSTNIIEF